MTIRSGAIFLWVCGVCVSGAGRSVAAVAGPAVTPTAGATEVVSVAARAGDGLTERANAAWEAKDWALAARLYEELSKEKDAPPRVWLRLGASLRGLGKYDQALAAFQKATEINAGPFAEYGKASTYAGMKDTEKAFLALEAAVKQGFTDLGMLTTDPNLQELRGDARFE